MSGAKFISQDDETTRLAEGVDKTTHSTRAAVKRPHLRRGCC